MQNDNIGLIHSPPKIRFYFAENQDIIRLIPRKMAFRSQANRYFKGLN